MKKYFLVIAFIVLLVFITVPASADGDLHHYDIYSEDTTAFDPIANCDHVCSHVYASTCSAYSGAGTTNVQMRTGEGNPFQRGLSNVQEITPHIINNAVQYGNATMTGSFYCNNGWWTDDFLGIGSFTVNFWDYGGAVIPDAYMVCSPSTAVTGQSITCTDLSTNTPTSWDWEIWKDEVGYQTWVTGCAGLEDHCTFSLVVAGTYSVDFTAQNSAGADTYNVSHYLHINPATPFPNVTQTIVPNVTLFSNQTLPIIMLVNISSINDVIDTSPWGNLSAGYRSDIDSLLQNVNQTAVLTVELLISPFTMVTNTVILSINYFNDAFQLLTSYTIVSLALTAKYTNTIPLPIIALITASLAVDIFIVLVWQGKK
jgi:hypothetical protein